MNTITYVGLDVHKETIAVAVIDAAGEVFDYGETENSDKSIKRLVKGLLRTHSELRFCYEAGPCGYAIYHYLQKLGCECDVIAPSLIPRKPGEKVKTDRRDAQRLARLHRMGELTAVCVPDEKQEALRDLFRAREDAVIAFKRAKQNLNAFLLRYKKRYPGRHRWSKDFHHWLRTMTFEHRAQGIVLEDYIEAVHRNGERVELLGKQLTIEFDTWELRPIGEALMALRGIDLITVMGILTELGDLRRFEHPQQLMAYVGLVPTEYSSGDRRKQGSITKTGNNHVRRLLTESAWCCRLKPRRSRHWKLRAQHASSKVQEISWKAMLRLHNRFWKLSNRKLSHKKVVIAVARELLGFIWAVAQQAYKEQSGSEMKQAA